MRSLLLVLVLCVSSPAHAKTCRVYYRADGTVAVVYPMRKRRTRREGMRKVFTETASQYYASVYAEAEEGSYLAGLPYDDIDDKTLPSRVHRAKWRRSKGGAGVMVDDTVVSPKEQQAAKEVLVDEELAKPSPDFKRIFKLKRRGHAR